MQARMNDRSGKFYRRFSHCRKPPTPTAYYCNRSANGILEVVIPKQAGGQGPADYGRGSLSQTGSSQLLLSARSQRVLTA